MSIFTEIYERKTEQFILETRHFFAIWDAFPVNPGHALVIPKREIEVLPLLNRDEWSALLPTILKVMKIIESTNKKVLYEKLMVSDIGKSEAMIQDALDTPWIDRKPDAYNHGLNNGQAAGQTVDHMHWHIIPRYEGDVEDPRGGVRHLIPGKGNYRKLMNDKEN